MRRAWIFGDSHAAGTGLYPNDVAREYQDSYPCQLARRLDHRDIQNHSLGGHSNDAIFRWVTESLADIDRDDVVILCWSEEARTEIWSDIVDDWMHLIPPGQGLNYDLWYRKRLCLNACLGITNELDPYPKGVQEYYSKFRSAWQKILNTDNDCKTYRMNFIKNCLAANQVLENQHISKVINIRSQASILFDLDYNDKLDPLLQNHYWPVTGTVFRNWALHQGFSEDKYHHLPLSAHEAFADFVHSHMIQHGTWA